MSLLRHVLNPILTPCKDRQWESYAAFNGTVIRHGESYIMLYRAMGDEMNIDAHHLRLSVVGKAISHDGYNFSDRTPFITPEMVWERYGCEDPRATYIDGKYYIFYTALASFPPNADSIKVAVAVTSDFQTIESRHLVTPFNAKAMCLFPEKINGKYTVLFTVNTDRPPSHMVFAQVDALSQLWSPDFWSDWYKKMDQYIVPLQRVNSDGLEVGAPPILTEHGWLLIYSYIKHYHNQDVRKQFRIEAVMLDRNNIAQIVGRVEQPLLIPEATYELKGTVNDIVFPSGALRVEDELRVYYGGADTVCAAGYIKYDELIKNMETGAPYTLKAHKFPHNPLLLPITEHKWEAQAVFNPAALQLRDKTFLLYRSLSADNVSYIGMAVSQDGLLIDERLDEPIYPLRSKFEKPQRPGGGGGCEDPRVTLLGDRIYMLYTAYDGVLPRLAMTSIHTDDFYCRRWQKWDMPIIISPPGIGDKDGMLFPEKVNGHYVFFHRIEPNICIDFVPSLQFENGAYLKSQGVIPPQWSSWEGHKIGINAAPLKTADGWLALYHGISAIDHHYRIGALLLDLQDVTKVVGRTPYPILEPETVFEHYGVVNHVVFPCGYVVRNDLIHIYYGGADKVVCGATISLSKLLKYLRDSAVKKYGFTT